MNKIQSIIGRNVGGGRNKGTEGGAGATAGASGVGGNTGGGGGEGDEGSIKLSSQIGSLFEIMTNVLKMTGIGNHKMVLDPISKLVIFIQSNSMGLFNCNFITQFGSLNA